MVLWLVCVFHPCETTIIIRMLSPLKMGRGSICVWAPYVNGIAVLSGVAAKFVRL